MPSPGPDGPLPAETPLTDQQMELLSRYSIGDITAEETAKVEALTGRSSLARDIVARHERANQARGSSSGKDQEARVDTAMDPIGPSENKLGGNLFNSKVLGPVAAFGIVAMGLGLGWNLIQYPSRSVLPAPGEKSVTGTTVSPLSAQSPITKGSSLPQPPAFQTPEPVLPANLPARSTSLLLLPEPLPLTPVGDPGSKGEERPSSSSLNMVAKAYRDPLTVIHPQNTPNEKTKLVPQLNVPLVQVNRVTVSPPTAAPPKNSPLVNVSRNGPGTFALPAPLEERGRLPRNLGFYVPQLPPSSEESPPDASSSLNNAPSVRNGNLEAVDYGATASTLPPFKVVSEIISSPWNIGKKVVMIGVVAYTVPPQIQKVPANLAFVIDDSISMDEPERLPLIKNALVRFVDQLGDEDHLGIVLYAGGVVTKLLPSTACTERTQILSAIYSLQTYPGQAFGPSLQTAYQIVQAHFLKEACNRVIIVTDGDYNFGLDVKEGLLDYVDMQARNGIGLSLIGVGRDILLDSQWRSLIQLGRGTYAQVSNVTGATQALMLQKTRQLRAATAEDVRVELNVDENQLKNYRLLGYQNQWAQGAVVDPMAAIPPHILALYEMETNDAVVSTRPMQIKASYRSSKDSDYVSVLEPVPPLIPGASRPSLTLRDFLARVEAQARLQRQREVESQKAIKTDSGLVSPGLPPAQPSAVDGKVTKENFQNLEDRAKVWLENQSRETAPPPSH